MTTPTPDPMDERYRRASAEEAGTPSAATRETIRARAAAVAAEAKASKTAPKRGAAANDARYWMRVVAGVAVLGVGVLLWRQMDHRMPGETAQVEVLATAEQSAPTDSAAPEARDVARERPTPPAPAALREPSPVVRSTDAPEAPPPPAPVAPLAAPPSAPASPPPPPPALQESFRAEARERNTASATMSASLDAALAGQLAQQLPQAWQSQTPRDVWLVRDADGAVLASGEGIDDLDGVAMRVRALPVMQGRTLGPWRNRALPNAQGQLLQVYETRAR